MNVRLLLGWALCALALLGGRAAGEEPRFVELEVRERMSLLRAGTPVADARIALVVAGEGPVEAREAADRTDAEGRARIAVPPEGAVLLVWKDGFSPAAYRLEGQGRRRIGLVPERRLTVDVRDPRGRPAAGAQVRVDIELPLIGSPFPELDVHRYSLPAMTGADGTVEIDGLTEHPVALTASRDDALLTTRFPVWPGDDPVRLDLRRGASVAGTVHLLPSGRPAEGTTVSVSGRSVEVDAEGKFELDLLEPGLADLTVSGAGFVAQQPRRIALLDGRSREGLAIELLETAGVSGSLHLATAPGQPQPLPGETQATFRFTWPPGSAPERARARPEPAEHLVTAGPGGQFRIDGLPPADGVTLEVRRDGSVPVLRRGLSLRPGHTLEGLWIELVPGGVLHGVVTAPDSAPAAGVQVLASRSDPTGVQALAGTVTDADGRFELAGLPAEPVMLDLIPPPGVSAAPTRAGPFEAPREKAGEGLALDLDLGFTLRGSVTDGVAGLAAWVVQDGPERGPYPIAGGSLEIPGLRAGPAVLVLRDVAGAEQRVYVAMPLLAPLRLHWQRPHEVLVRIVDAAGEPVPEAVVTVARIEAGPSAASAVERPLVDASKSHERFDHRGASGRFLVQLPPGRFRIAVTAPDGSFGEAAVDVGMQGSVGLTEQVDIRLLGAETVRGHVFSHVTSAPVEGASVRVLANGTAPGATAPASFTDERGWFAVKGVNAGIVRVLVEAPGYAPTVTEPAIVPRGAGLLIGQIDLIEGTRVTGVVRSGRAPLPSGMRMELRDGNGRVISAHLDRFGRFELVGALPGVAILTLSQPAGRTVVERRIVVPYDEPLDVELDLDDGTIAFGLVTTAGRPEAFASVRAVAEDEYFGEGVRVEVRADARGRYRLPPLPAGPVRMEVTPVGTNGTWETQVLLPRAFDTPVDLQLPEGWLAGTVIEARGGAPVAGAFVTATLIDDAGLEVSRSAVSDVSGAFRIERLVPGDHVVEASREGYGVAFPTRVSVAAGKGVSGTVVTLPMEARIAAQILDRTRRAVPGAWLLAESATEGDRSRVRVAADARGRALLTELAPGPWRLLAGAAGQATRDLGVLDVERGIFDLGEIHLQPESALRIVVFSPGLFPIAGVEVSIEDALGRDPRTGRVDVDPLFGLDPRFVTDARGEVLVCGLPPGIYHVGLARDPEDRTAVRVGLEEIAAAFVLAPLIPADVEPEEAAEEPGEELPPDE